MPFVAEIVGLVTDLGHLLCLPCALAYGKEGQPVRWDDTFRGEALPPNIAGVDDCDRCGVNVGTLSNRDKRRVVQTGRRDPDRIAGDFHQQIDGESNAKRATCGSDSASDWY